MTIYGLSLTLSPAPHRSNPIALADWLPEVSVRPVLIPAIAHRGLVKVILALPHWSDYPELLRSLTVSMAEDSAVHWQGESYNVVGIASDRDDLRTLSLTIQAEKSFPKHKDIARACHAIVLSWFKSADPALSEALHTASSVPLRLNYRLVEGKKLHLYLSLLRGDLFASLLWGLHGHLEQKLTIVNITCRLASQVNILGGTTWETLAATESQSAIALNFHSATSFMQNGDVQPFLLPDLVFGSLLRRWNAFAPETLHFDPIAAWSGRVAAYDLKTTATYLNGAFQIGSVGWVRYEFKDPELAAIASILAAFAPFSGIGRKTMLGMGQVSLRSGDRGSRRYKI